MPSVSETNVTAAGAENPRSSGSRRSTQTCLRCRTGIERAAGWSRQLRLTPLSPTGYILTKMLSALVLGLCSVLAVYTVGRHHRRTVDADPHLDHHCPVPVDRMLVFAAFGLFIGYLLPSENVMRIIGFALMLFAFGAGVFIPLRQFSPTLRTLAQFTPLYDLSQLVHFPLQVGCIGTRAERRGGHARTGRVARWFHPIGATRLGSAAITSVECRLPPRLGTHWNRRASLHV
jgi:ABC-2 type transporter